MYNKSFLELTAWIAKNEYTIRLNTHPLFLEGVCSGTSFPFPIYPELLLSSFQPHSLILSHSQHPEQLHVICKHGHFATQLFMIKEHQSHS